jgi:hypothetical protein
MGLRKQFREYGVAAVNSDHYERQYCDIEKTLRFDRQFLDQFMSADLKFILYHDIAFEILQIPSGTPAEAKFRNFFYRRIDDIIDANWDAIESVLGYDPDIDPDYAQAVNEAVWDNVMTSLKESVDDIMIAGTSVQQPRIKKADLRLLVP